MKDLEGGDHGGLLAHHRSARAHHRLETLADGPLPAAPVLRRVATRAAAARTAAALDAAGGLDVDDRFKRLRRAEKDCRDAIGRWLAASSRSPDALNRRTLPAVAALATALRSGRATRRAQLARIDDRLTRALPLWLGTLGDIDDLLPPAPALFDVVLLDEASCIDQPLAAPALLRADAPSWWATPVSSDPCPSWATPPSRRPPAPMAWTPSPRCSRSWTCAATAPTTSPWPPPR